MSGATTDIVEHGERPTDRAEEHSHMRMGTETRRWTWEEFRRLPDEPGVTYEFVDGDERRVTVVQPRREPVTVRDVLTWNPAGASEPLTLAHSQLFG